MLYFKNLNEEIPMHKAFMLMRGKDVEPAVYIRTPNGFFGADVESLEDVGYDSANVFFIPADSDYDICDVARIKTAKENQTKESDIEFNFFGDIGNEDPTDSVIISRENIEEAFMIED